MNHFLKIALVTLGSLWAASLSAQLLDAANITSIQLSEGTQLNIAKKISGFDQVEEAYYYLPANLNFSRSKSNEPEFSYLTYKEGEEITGGILHFLIKWGLTRDQLKEADSLLKNVKGNEAILMGAVMPEAETPLQSFTVEGDSKIAGILNNSKSTIGKVALLPHTKMAASFHINKEDALPLQQMLQNNSGELEEVYLVLNFKLKFKEPNKPGIVIAPYQIKENFKNLLNR
jgi:hypothetical protein